AATTWTTSTGTGSWPTSRCWPPCTGPTRRPTATAATARATRWRTPGATAATPTTTAAACCPMCCAGCGRPARPSRRRRTTDEARGAIAIAASAPQRPARRGLRAQTPLRNAWPAAFRPSAAPASVLHQGLQRPGIEPGGGAHDPAAVEHQVPGVAVAVDATVATGRHPVPQHHHGIALRQHLPELGRDRRGQARADRRHRALEEVLLRAVAARHRAGSGHDPLHVLVQQVEQAATPF